MFYWKLAAPLSGVQYFFYPIPRVDTRGYNHITLFEGETPWIQSKNIGNALKYTPEGGVGIVAQCKAQPQLWVHYKHIYCTPERGAAI